MRIDEILNEGVNDKHIFKAIYMAGGPGSGKNYVASKTTSEFGLRSIDYDDFIEYHNINHHNINMQNDEKMTQSFRSRADIYLDGRLGVVIQGTGQNLGRIEGQKLYFEQVGYETMMIFVNTDLEIALDRNSKRSRVVPDDILINTWNDAQKSIPRIKQLFGSNFHLVNNNNDSNELNELSNKVRQFVNKPITNPVALQWIKDQNENR